ncbi:hypothetical protein QTG54_015003 [Skeletonema marinoi]|uniref:Uncharacterized protein n=1 Tax=Skeletonema marinoi TaxID=267567 RepID=A0AAD8XVS5_9STRA|nr:hypothetical protein QTG54_015003 [Skeletonema marinoi]
MPTNTNTTDVANDIDLSAIAAAADPAKEEDIEAIDGARARQGTAFYVESSSGFEMGISVFDCVFMCGDW